MKLLMISGRGASETAMGKRNAFWNTLEELRKHFERIDVIAPKMSNDELLMTNQFSNVAFYLTDGISQTGLEIYSHHHFDIMTVHEYAPFQNGRAANKIWEQIKIPMMFEIMHIPGMPRAGNWKELIARAMTRLYIAHDVHHASAVRVINKQVGEWLISLGIPKEKIKLMPAFYIDLEIFKPMNLEKKYDLLFVGRRAANKGVALFENAVRKLKAKSYLPDGQAGNLKALIVDGWAKDSHELAKIYNESKLLIVPSYSEGGPRVMLEALACGTPALVTRVGLAPELLPPDMLIDWSADDIVRKAQKILSGDFVFPKINMQQFEKTFAIKAYADVLKTL